MSTTTTVEALEVHLPEDADSILSMKSSKPAPTSECRSELEGRAGEKLSRPPFWARPGLPPADCYITIVHETDFHRSKFFDHMFVMNHNVDLLFDKLPEKVGSLFRSSSVFSIDHYVHRLKNIHVRHLLCVI